MTGNNQFAVGLLRNTAYSTPVTNNYYFVICLYDYIGELSDTTIQSECR